MYITYEDSRNIYLIDKSQFMAIYQHYEGRTWNIKYKITNPFGQPWKLINSKTKKQLQRMLPTIRTGNSQIDNTSKDKMNYYIKFGNFPGFKCRYNRLPLPMRKFQYAYNHFAKHCKIFNRDLYSFKQALAAWSKAVRSRDNTKCQICNMTAEHAHHIFYVSNYPKLALNLNNGIALCKEHHKEIHSFGYKPKP